MKSVALVLLLVLPACGRFVGADASEGNGGLSDSERSVPVRGGLAGDETGSDSPTPGSEPGAGGMSGGALPIFLSTVQLKGDELHDESQPECERQARERGLDNPSAFEALLSFPDRPLSAIIDASATYETISTEPATPLGTGAALLAGTIGAAIADTNAPVWTGASSGGGIAETCSGWTASSGAGVVGRADTAGLGWMTGGTESCSGTAVFYCVAVPN